MMESPLCTHCEAKGLVKLGEELDHIVPVSKGGSNDPSNLQMLCKECHAQKTIADLGYKPKPQIGLDGWPQNDAEKFAVAGGERKSKPLQCKTVPDPLLKKTSVKKA